MPEVPSTNRSITPGCHSGSYTTDGLRPQLISFAPGGSAVTRTGVRQRARRSKRTASATASVSAAVSPSPSTDASMPSAGDQRGSWLLPSASSGVSQPGRPWTLAAVGVATWSLGAATTSCGR